MKDSKKCCVVIITHKAKLDGDDEKSFKRCIEVFGGRRDIILLLPDNISYEYYDEFKDDMTIKKIDNKWFKNIHAYNTMLCEDWFYEMFTDYDYMLVYQTDCWVFNDRLDEFISMGYDWYGAPWGHLRNKIGNGGFSLRNINKMLEITRKNRNNNRKPEDLWFCDTHGDELNTCDLKTACNFSMENMRNEYLPLINDCPMGLHGKSIKSAWGNENYFNELKNNQK